MMKNLFTATALLYALSYSAQVGIGNNEPNGVLDLTNTNKHVFVLPNIQNEEVIEKVNSTKNLSIGSMYFDLDLNCLRVLHKDDEWKCLSGNSSIVVERLGCPSVQAPNWKASEATSHDNIILYIDLPTSFETHIKTGDTIFEGSLGDIGILGNKLQPGDLINLGETEVPALALGSNIYTILLKNPVSVDISNSNRVFHSPFGGDQGMQEDFCGWPIE
ncbi:hypothetical protein UJ101_01591 [Flavobacteriaceae bacterium UJ101]|nr:hypothetical protein UJ101_01591 [Flavobacteriaceae bacterium UJ101]